MKRLFTILLLSLSTTVAVSATSPKSLKPAEILRKYSKAIDLEKQTIGGLLMTVATLFGEGVNPGVHSITMYDFSMCPDVTLAALNDDIRRVDKSGYEAMIATHHHGQNNVILIDCDSKAIREVMIIDSGENYCEIIHIKGRIKPENIEKLMHGQF